MISDQFILSIKGSEYGPIILELKFKIAARIQNVFHVVKQMKLNALNKSNKLIILSASLQSIRMLIGAIHSVYLLTAGVALQDIALLQIVFSMTVLIAEFPTGVFTDVQGRKAGILISTVLFSTYYLICLLAPNLPALILSEVVYGLAFSFLSGAIQGWLLEAIREEYEQVDKNIVYFNHLLAEFSAFGMMICGVMGAFIAYSGQIRAFKMVYILSSMLFLIIAISFLFVNESSGSKNAAKKQYYTIANNALRQVFATRSGVMYVLCISLISATLQPVLHFWQPLFLESIRVTNNSALVLKSEIILMGAIFFCSNFLTYVSNRYLRRYFIGKYNYALIGPIFGTMCLMALFLSAYLAPRSTFLLLASYGLLRGTLPILITVIQSKFYQEMPSAEASSIISATLVMERLTSIFSLILIRMTLNRFNLTAVFYEACIPLVVFIIFFLMWNKKERIMYVNQ